MTKKQPLTPEENAKIKRLEKLEFITTKDLCNFLSHYGYDIVGYENYCGFYRHHRGFNTWNSVKNDIYDINKSLILIGPPAIWGNHVKNFHCKDVVRNPFVKYLSFNFMEFRIFTLVENEDANLFGIDEHEFSYELEKDLSHEWIKYLALKDENYAKYILDKCDKIQNEELENIKTYNNLLAQDIARLKSQTERRIAECNNALNKYDKIAQIVKSAKSDLQV